MNATKFWNHLHKKLGAGTGMCSNHSSKRFKKFAKLSACELTKTSHDERYSRLFLSMKFGTDRSCEEKHKNNLCYYTEKKKLHLIFFIFLFEVKILSQSKNRVSVNVFLVS